MSKKVLEILNDFRKWNTEWQRFDKGLTNKKPLSANEFAKTINIIYNIEDNE